MPGANPYFPPIDHNRDRGKKDVTTHLGDGYTRKNGITYGPIDQPEQESNFGTPSKPEDIKQGPVDPQFPDVESAGASTPEVNKPQESTDSTQFLKDMKAQENRKYTPTPAYGPKGDYKKAQQDFVDQAIKRQLPSQQVIKAANNELFAKNMSPEERDKRNAKIREERERDFNLINSTGNDNKFRGLANDDHEKFMAQKDSVTGKTNAELYANKGGQLGADGVMRRADPSEKGQVYTNILHNAKIRSNEGNAANDKQNVENLSSAKMQLAFDAVTSIPILRPVGLLARGGMLIASRIAAKQAAKKGVETFGPRLATAAGTAIREFSSSPMINTMTTALGGAKGFIPSMMTSLGVSKMATSLSNYGNATLAKDGTANQFVQGAAGVTDAASNLIGFNALTKPFIKGGVNLLARATKASPGLGKFMAKPLVQMGLDGAVKTAQFVFAAQQGLQGVGQLREGKTREGFESLGNAFGISKPGIATIGKTINKFTAAFTQSKPYNPSANSIDIGKFQQGPPNLLETPPSTSTVSGSKPQLTNKPTVTPKASDPIPTKPSDPIPTKTPPTSESTPTTNEPITTTKTVPDTGKGRQPDTGANKPTSTKEVDPRIAQDAGKFTNRAKPDPGNTGNRVQTATEEPNITFGKTPGEPNIATKGGGGLTIDKGENKGGGLTITGGKGGGLITTKQGGAVTTTTKEGGAVTTKDKTGGGKPPEPPPKPKPIPKEFPAIPSLGGGGGGESAARPSTQHTARGLPTQADPSYRETSIEVNYFSEMGF
jgi:hypothetical protein